MHTKTRTQKRQKLKSWAPRVLKRYPNFWEHLVLTYQWCHLEGCNGNSRCCLAFQRSQGWRRHWQPVAGRTWRSQNHRWPATKVIAMSVSCVFAPFCWHTFESQAFYRGKRFQLMLSFGLPTKKCRVFSCKANLAINWHEQRLWNENVQCICI